MTATLKPNVTLRLADFLEAQGDVILAEWVTFARKLAGADGMDVTALRDHAAAMLTVIAADLRTPQTAAEQRDKAQGEAVDIVGAAATAAESHGVGRADSGFTVAEMLAEFRALRASVVRLWTAEERPLSAVDVADLGRFHEAIDQALGESITRFNRSVELSQSLLVAVLGHDLRTPLHTVTMVTEHVVQADLLDAEHASLMVRAVRSTRRMTRMLDDVVDFTRSRMGAGLGVHPQDTDLRPVVQEAVDEMRSSSPGNAFIVDVTGDLRGAWDSPRIAQVLANLLGNAVQHGSRTAPVRVAARGGDREVVLEVRNDGPPIAADNLPTLFSPFKRLRNADTGRASAHLGLGLYIANEIVTAHGGRITVTSSEAEGTCFSAHLPRRQDNLPMTASVER
ncbi:MAG TPA: sensor histidine kinase [Gemmatimonas sp.]|nr:sensor histidine kinase [Gemmatimonas sp.]